MLKFMLFFMLLLTDSFAQNNAIIKSLVDIDQSINNVHETNQNMLYFRGKYQFPISKEVIENQNISNEIKINTSISDNIALIKYHIINGNLEKAKAKLLQAQFSENFSSIIQKRYMALIYFIEGEYSKSLEILEAKEFYTFENNKHVCLLRNLNYLILNRNQDALSDWKICRDATINKTSNYHLWINTIIELKANKTKISDFQTIKNLNIENETGELLTIFLKMALYLNEPQKILSRLSYLDSEIFENKKLRELIGLLYFRDRQLLNAYNFIEDLNSANSENLKGNLFLAQKKYELAFAQFKLALNKKSNSQNAIERMIPTAWILKQWQDGLDYIKKLETTKEDQYKKLAIKAAFEIQLNDFQSAKNSLEKIIKESKNAQTSEINIMASQVYFFLKDKDLSMEFSDKACKNLDGVNCWLQFQLLNWQDFTKTAQRDELIFDDSMNLLETYKSDYQKMAIEEELLIDQKDIEELDNSLISLLPN